MRILLDAYFDMNFGDDLFVRTVTDRYPDALFYVFWKKTPAKVLKRALQSPNMVILPEACDMQTIGTYDAYVSVGGDIYPDGVDYSARIARMEAVKKQNGFVAMLGFSLYASYGEETKEALRKMAGIADVVLCRDEESAKLYRSFAPEAEIISGTDMAFLNPVLERLAQDKSGKEAATTGKKILGFAPRRRLYTPDDVYENYCKAMAKVADGYLEQNEDALVRFLALSVGEYDDNITCADIIKHMKQGDRTQVLAYDGDLERFMEQAGELTCMVPTRFHGMVLALALGIPFVPVPYEVKLSQLLKELKYDKALLPYGEEVEDALVQTVLSQLTAFPVEAGEMALYEQKKQLMFAGLDAYLDKIRKEGRDENGNDAAGEQTKEAGKDGESAEGEIRCTAAIRCAEQAIELEAAKKQIKELEKWIAALQEQQKNFEKANQDLEAIRVSQVETIENLKMIQMQHDEQLHDKDVQLDELKYWIDSLKDERKRFEIQNVKLEEIRKWQLEKLRKRVHNHVKLQREYNAFVQGLDEELKEKYGTSI